MSNFPLSSMSENKEGGVSISLKIASMSIDKNKQKRSQFIDQQRQKSVHIWIETEKYGTHK